MDLFNKTITAFTALLVSSSLLTVAAAAASDLDRLGSYTFGRKEIKEPAIGSKSEASVGDIIYVEAFAARLSKTRLLGAIKAEVKGITVTFEEGKLIGTNLYQGEFTHCRIISKKAAKKSAPEGQYCLWDYDLDGKVDRLRYRKNNKRQFSPATRIDPVPYEKSETIAKYRPLEYEITFDAVEADTLTFSVPFVPEPLSRRGGRFSPNNTKPRETKSLELNNGQGILKFKGAIISVKRTGDQKISYTVTKPYDPWYITAGGAIIVERENYLITLR